MSTAIETEQWRSVESSELLEKRTYKSGRVNYYVKSSYAKTWGRVEGYLAEEHWLAEKWFVKEEEYKQIKQEQNEGNMRRFWLSMAQKVGGFDAHKLREEKRFGIQKDGTV